MFTRIVAPKLVFTAPRAALAACTDYRALYNLRPSTSSILLKRPDQSAWWFIPERPTTGRITVGGVTYDVRQVTVQDRRASLPANQRIGQPSPRDDISFLRGEFVAQSAYPSLTRGPETPGSWAPYPNDGTNGRWV